MNFEKIIYSQNEDINIDNKFEYMKEDFLLYIKAKEMIPSNKFNTNFDSCSNRLKHALYRAHVFTLKDLLELSPSQIMNIPNLGRECFVELYDFLLTLSNDTKISKISDSAISVEVEEKLKKIRFINENRKEFFIEFKTTILEEDTNIEEYKHFYMQLINHIYESAKIKLKPREQSIIMSRFGVGEEPKTLQEIGEIHSISRERVRQLLVKSMRILGHKHISSIPLLDLEYDKISLIVEIDKYSASDFISFLFLSGVNLPLIKFVSKYYFRSEIDIDKFRRYFLQELSKKQREQVALNKIQEFNDNINKLITFPRKRYITEQDFSRLKTERIVNLDDPEIKMCIYNNRSYQCESFLEHHILYKLLMNNTFKEIKTQSLQIPHNGRYYYPDFQCLTHDNLFVIVEVKPLLNMCEYKNIEKFKSLKEYCEKYGFGYLILDERGHSYEHVNEENTHFSEMVLNYISRFGNIKYAKYKEIYNRTNASGSNLLTLIKKHNLHLSFPFKFEK